MTNDQHTPRTLKQTLPVKATHRLCEVFVTAVTHTMPATAQHRVPAVSDPRATLTGSLLARLLHITVHLDNGNNNNAHTQNKQNAHA